MKKSIAFIALLGLCILPARAFAISAPTVDAVPAAVDANTRLLFIRKKGQK